MSYHLTQNTNDLKELAKRLGDVSKFGLDSETEGFRLEHGDRFIGLSISLGADREKDDHYYVPVRHQVGTNHPIPEVQEHLGPLFKHPKITKVLQNAKFAG